jgi:hypothetical protein
MKTSNLIKLTVVTATLAAFTAQAGIVGTKHDFSRASWNTDTSDPNTVCGVCHTPHHADANAGPLWGHTTITTTGWKMYSNLNSPGANIKYSPALAPTGASLACLSCHDGSVAVNAYGNVPVGQYEYMPTNGTAISEFNKDLTHSHPISFNYESIRGVGVGKDQFLFPSGNQVLTPDANSPGGFNPGSDMSIAGFLLDGKGNVECSSCHDVHGQVGTPWGVNNNVKINGTQAGVGSLLCRSCHDK